VDVSVGIGGSVNKYRGYREEEEPLAVPIDKEAEQRELKEAGWELIETATGKILWRNPESDHLYPQGAAISLLRRKAHSDASSKGPGGGAR
jgi:hypothetical protein